MATRTLGTIAATTLVAVPWPDLASGAQPADFAAINALIKDDTASLWPVGNAGTDNGQNATQAAAAQNRMPTAFSSNGTLFIPSRGVLKIFPGDWIAVDGYGWPILVSGRSVQSGSTGFSSASWTHTGNPT